MNLRPFQIVLTVSDLDRSVKFYSQFGFRTGKFVQKEDGRTRITLIPEGVSDFELKLFSNPSAKSLPSSSNTQEYLKETGTKYMSLLVDDVDLFYAGYKEKINFLAQPKDGMTGCRYVFFRDPDNILVEVYQKPISNN